MTGLSNFPTDDTSPAALQASFARHSASTTKACQVVMAKDFAPLPTFVRCNVQKSLVCSSGKGNQMPGGGS